MVMLAKIRRMHFRDGLPLREIAKRTGLARNTIRRWLRSGQSEPVYPKRASPSRLDAYRPQLETWLRVDSHRPRREQRTAKVLFAQLQAIGYPGTYTRVTAFIRQWKAVGGASRRQIWIEAGARHWPDFATLNAWLADECRAAWPTQAHPDAPDITVAEALEDEHPHLMPMPGRFDGYIEVPVRVSSTALVTFQRNRYSVPCEHAHAVASLRVYPFELVVVVGDAIVARHRRSFVRDRVHYDWQHYITLVQRKPGALRDGAPFLSMPEPLRMLQQQLLRQPQGDRAMAQVLAAVPVHGLDAVLVAIELVLESGAVRAEHVLNVLARLQHPTPVIETVATSITLRQPPASDPARYDRLRQEVDHVGA